MHKITKISASTEPRYSSASSINTYRESLTDNILYSPSIDYWVIGDITCPPQIGVSVMMDRWVRNGVLSRGRFSTSPVVKIDENRFETMNSVYEIEEVDDESILELTSQTTVLL
jgi:hypothetical protein